MKPAALSEASEEAWELKEAVRVFVEREVDTRWDEIESSNEIPQELVVKSRELGLFGLSIPEEYGGLGLSTLEKSMLEEELGKSSYGYATFVGNHTGISSTGIVVLGSPEQKETYLPRMASGELIGSFALTEPGAGSDASSIRTRAVRSGDGWVLNGEKIFITNASEAGIFTVIAKSGDGRLSAFLVEAENPGLVVGPNEKKMGMRGAHTCPVSLNDCRVPAEALLGEEGRGLRAALGILTRGRITLASRCVGMAQRALDLALEYSQQRQQFGRSIASNQGIQWMLADMHVQIEAARLLVYEAARAMDLGESCKREAAVAKLFATEAQSHVVDLAVQIHGGMGYMNEMPIERLYRDARISRIYEGTSEIQRNIIAGELLKGVQ